MSVLVCLVFSCLAAVQPQFWRSFSSPDKSLRVELPERPKLLKNRRDSPDLIFKNGKSGYSYSIKLSSGNDTHPELLFGVLHLSKPITNRSFDKTVNSNMLWMAGDDKHFSKEIDVIRNGFHGREFVFDKGDMSGRALFINGGTRIYYLFFQTESEDGIPSVSRIFNSFRPLR